MKPSLHGGLRRQLLFWLLAVNLLVLGLSVVVTDRLVRFSLSREPDWPALAEAAQAAYRQDGVAGLRRWRDDARDGGIDATLYTDADDQPLLPQPLPPHLRRYLPQLLAAETPITLRAGRAFWLGAVPLAATGELPALRLVGVRGPQPPRARRDLLLAMQLLLSALAVGALAVWLARSLTRPLAALQTATQRMAAGDLAARTDAGTAARGDEIGALAHDFNHMAARIETLVAQQRTVLQDVSHELRSPLARLHVLIELAGQGATDDGRHQLERATRELVRLDDLIAEVLDLSRLEAALPGLAPTPVALDVLLDELVQEHALDAGTRGVRLVLDERGATDAVVPGDARLLARAVGNVLGNAIKFSPAGGEVVLSLAREAATLRLSIRDHGPGVPAEQLPKLFQPFYRGVNAALAEGHGLGLAIAQRIVRAHGGRIVAEAAGPKPGDGLRVTIELPSSKNGEARR